MWAFVAKILMNVPPTMVVVTIFATTLLARLYVTAVKDTDWLRTN
jgi:hypothetical protein